MAYGGTKLGPQSKMIESKIAFLHPAFDLSTNENDLGIILLPATAVNNGKYTSSWIFFTLIKNDLISILDFLKPIALPISNIITPRINEEGSVSGFGITDDIAKPAPNEDLKTTYLTVLKAIECPIQGFVRQESSNFCARDIFFGSRLCRGDMGSAFVILQRGIPTLAGVASQVSEKCLATSGHDASAFVRIQTYLTWIKSLTGLE